MLKLIFQVFSVVIFGGIVQALVILGVVALLAAFGFGLYVSLGIALLTVLTGCGTLNAILEEYNDRF